MDALLIFALFTMVLITINCDHFKEEATHYKTKYYMLKFNLDVQEEHIRTLKETNKMLKAEVEKLKGENKDDENKENIQ